MTLYQVHNSYYLLHDTLLGMLSNKNLQDYYYASRQSFMYVIIEFKCMIISFMTLIRSLFEILKNLLK